MSAPCQNAACRADPGMKSFPHLAVARWETRGRGRVQWFAFEGAIETSSGQKERDRSTERSTATCRLCFRVGLGGDGGCQSPMGARRALGPGAFRLGHPASDAAHVSTAPSHPAKRKLAAPSGQRKRKRRALAEVARSHILPPLTSAIGGRKSSRPRPVAVRFALRYRKGRKSEWRSG